MYCVVAVLVDITQESVAKVTQAKLWQDTSDIDFGQGTFRRVLRGLAAKLVDAPTPSKRIRLIVTLC